MDKAPVALFVYNRPWHTQRAIEALQKNKYANKSDLFVFSDAPKKPEAAVAVQAVRDYVKTINGFSTINVIERTENLGLANSVISGVTRLCREYDRVIVLEDDLVTSPYFLEYMNTALERYQGEERVMQIAGYMFPVKLALKDDALFLPFISSWGWATWQRAWRHFDPHTKGYERLLADSTLRKQFNLNGHYNYFRLLQAQRRGKIDSWAIWWYLSVFQRHGLALYPTRTLVRNLGFDGSGVNCAVSKFAQDDLEAEFRVNLLPELIEVSAGADQVMNHIPVPKLSVASIFNRLMGLINNCRS